jgi:outer membrane protein assembly factor BamB
VVTSDLKSLQLPPYLAALTVVDEVTSATLDATLVEKLFQSMRPFGGTTLLLGSPEEQKRLQGLIEPLKLANLVCTPTESGLKLTREGALPGSANWTHEHGDATNCRVSKDQLVKAPLGLLWFGGPPHDGILPRHGHGPQPQVLDGRLIIEGVDMLRAIDIYTGRLLWEASLPGVGAFYDNLAHQPGANASSSNYISMPEGIYVAHRGSCVVLDPATGKQIKKHDLPIPEGKKQPSRWGYLNVAGDYLIGGSDPLLEAAPFPEKSSSTTAIRFPRMSDNDNFSSSKQLFVMNRKTGELLWQADAKFGFRHNGICIGREKLFVIDRLSGAQLLRLKKEGKTISEASRLVAFELKSGKGLWSADDEIFGTWLSYSEKHDVLVEAGRVARDTLSDEPKGMRAYRASNGTVMWFEKTYVGPAMLHGDTIYKDTTACDLLTGENKLRPDPITGKPIPWSFARNYGCNTPLAAEHLLTFRSGAAGYCDLLNDSGTGNFGGFRSSCTNNLIVGGGIITAPDYTRTCTCSYQNQCSIALVPMPEAEMWTSYGKMEVTGPVQQVGVNFGAPGDRKSEEGTLWLEFPSVGGSSPNLDVHVTGKSLSYFRQHASNNTGELPWVSASGVKGIETVSVTVVPKGTTPRAYTVRLYFAEPEAISEGERKFDLFLQGERKLDDFDIVKETKRSNRTLVKEFKSISISDELIVKFIPSEGTRKPPLICGLEIKAEK